MNASMNIHAVKSVRLVRTQVGNSNAHVFRITSEEGSEIEICLFGDGASDVEKLKKTADFKEYIA